jgi:uncharacterized protein (UPF0335 family)
MSEYGHNSGERETAPQSLTNASKEKLRQFVARIESLEEEIADRRLDLKHVYQEVKSLGFDTKALRSVISIRKKDADALAEAEMMLDLYLEALGDI